MRDEDNVLKRQNDVDEPLERVFAADLVYFFRLWVAVGRGDNLVIRAGCVSVSKSKVHMRNFFQLNVIVVGLSARRCDDPDPRALSSPQF